MRIYLRSNFLFIFFIFIEIALFGQYSNQSVKKPSIDFEAINKWPTLGEANISDDGKYVAYTLNNQPIENKCVFVIKNVDGSWSKEFIFDKTSPEFCFLGDNKTIVFINNDTLFFQTLSSELLMSVPNVITFKVPKLSNGEWLAYMRNTHKKELVLHNFITGAQRNYSYVKNFSFNLKGDALVINTARIQDSLTISELKWVQLQGEEIITLWSDSSVFKQKQSVENYNFDFKGTQLVFMVQDMKMQVINYSIWYFCVGMNKAELRVDNKSTGIDPELSISNFSPQFSHNSNNIFFKLQLNNVLKPDKDAVKVDVWGYKDVILQSEQLNVSFYKNVTYFASINVQNGRIFQLENTREKLETYAQDANADFVIVSNKRDVLWWKKEGQESFYLISLKDASRKFIKKGRPSYFSFSPMGKYLVYFDEKNKNYFNYDLSKAILKNISSRVSVRLDNDYVYYVPGRTYPRPFPIAGWANEDSALLIYDNYDIWNIDPKGIKLPENITYAYGQEHHIKLRLVNEAEALQGINFNEPLLLTGFNLYNKFNGFYYTHLGKKGTPEMLSMKPVLYYRVNSQIPDLDYFDQGMKPLKARNKNVWIVKRQSSIEAPNYFWTKNFIDYIPLSNLQPQKRYNWLSTELITWKQLDGSTSQGILYKPEDFDSTKKYPLLFSYYETFSYRLNEFPHPYFSEGRIDIPWFVSRGYLVFTPDIHYSIASVSGQTVGDCAVNSIVSAALFLSKKSYVNSSKMGIQGHSFAGGETFYLITQSKIFAAACAASSTVSDEISAYLSILRPNGIPTQTYRQLHAETGHDRIGTTLWQRPDLYTKASPILRANRVKTPLLIMHNQGDGAVDWGQGVEMFMALRRLEKKVWMLQYDEQEHILFGKSAIDFTIRMTQFFDHYLKDFLPPKWMTVGIPARFKGIYFGYELDKSNNVP